MEKNKEKLKMNDPYTYTLKPGQVVLFGNLKIENKENQTITVTINYEFLPNRVVEF